MIFLISTIKPRQSLAVATTQPSQDKPTPLWARTLKFLYRSEPQQPEHSSLINLDQQNLAYKPSIKDLGPNIT